MYMVRRKYTKVRSVADAARRAKSCIGQFLSQSRGFRSYYVLDEGNGVGVAVMNSRTAKAPMQRTPRYWSLFKQVCMTSILEIPKSLPAKF
jgi:hypothetical protein